MVLGHRRVSGATERKSVEHSRSEETDDETVVDAEQGNVLGHIISQLRPGADLSRVTLPTFILEPRSMLERITNFMAHPEILLTLPGIDDPVQRFVGVVKFYLSGWHIKPPGVKKPLNPILGEVYTAYWDYPDNTRGYYISEQTCHHPPKSSYFFAIPEHHVRIDGTLKPRSKFLGNSAASLMEGLAVMRFTNRNERYFVTQPNMYARGILFGKMKYELGDTSIVRCPELGLIADLEFKTKGYFGGSYNAIGGFIKDIKTDKQLYELSGFWHGEMFIKDLKTGKKELLFDATHAKHTPPTTRPMEEQGERESQRLWAKVNTAIKHSDHRNATDEKSVIENVQRQEAAARQEKGEEWRPKIFRPVRGGHGSPEEGQEDLDWVIDATIDGKTPEEQAKQILAIAPILPGQGQQQLQQTSSAPVPKDTAPQPTTAATWPTTKENTPHETTYHDNHDAPSHSQISQPFSPIQIAQKHLSNTPQAQPANISHPVPSAAPFMNQLPKGQTHPGSPESEMSRLSLQETHPRKTSEISPDGTPKAVPQHGEAMPKSIPALDAHRHGVTRMDSQTQEEDEFHDAEA